LTGAVRNKISNTQGISSESWCPAPFFVEKRKHGNKNSFWGTSATGVDPLIFVSEYRRNVLKPSLQETARASGSSTMGGPALDGVAQRLFLS